MKELVFFSHHVGSNGQTQVTKYGIGNLPHSPIMSVQALILQSMAIGNLPHSPMSVQALIFYCYQKHFFNPYGLIFNNIFVLYLL